MASKRPIILCFVAYYLPGYRSGGPVRTIANFVENLGDEFDIRIVTGDRDVLDKTPYPDVRRNEWNQVGKSKVFYVSKKELTLSGVAKIIRETKHDVLYLNSFFAFRFTVLPLLARRLGIAPMSRCVIAPRGEFSRGALALKVVKKRIYMRVARFLRLYSDVVWQASSEIEILDIKREFKVDTSSITRVSNIALAPDLPSKLDRIHQANLNEKDKTLNVLFLSRISPMKNLDFLLRVLGKARLNINLSICGPHEDNEYWENCIDLIDSLPGTVKIKIKGEIEHRKVSEEFAACDLFVLPTRGENFGHVIFEALSSGVPVLVSEHTPWKSDSAGALTALPLDEDRWLSEIERWSHMSQGELLNFRHHALAYASAYLARSLAVEQNRLLFSRVASKGAST